MALEPSFDRIVNAISELSKQLQEFQRGNREGFEALSKYKEEGALLEFTLITGGIISGKILWMDSQSFGIETDSGQNLVLYKHAISFIQRK